MKSCVRLAAHAVAMIVALTGATVSHASGLQCAAAVDAMPLRYPIAVVLAG
ncbi:hypothetical protein [Stenotrophomonas maltophilia]|uniref:hypothetical protein n=1 Tax=Stenotrophomonas maltophilia TaxID=40324 RepID=UPI000AF900C0|nr:hypothetical protein [Stenotrophomonas maltophilia]ELK2668104.1 hypothetical protein [Stenotrophomonas maltophilia]MBB5529588.1 hypothetical protein [Stenotrophomonas maltophilia]MBH1378866.1 hypothetical protein [Stenotrophomonas maltophilia]MBH1442050.1 hypothetical protein [Stenotrophomonas maltophilia]MBH1560511.1 hypothetical protein [Stenotrophomonas maltophilia]